ncbi:MAG: NfeD family protein [Bacteroidales bacterium]|jgi:membrane-bound serine protease (ClpP class)|nr:NfeD family protein [Bacteroidales bacterium]HPB02674.1 NfeD family protein [Bacteroidales bacterium]HPE99978.1 NfeD family protein [Bacteroidales bacterium]HQQ13541.1 NfeD family protein [Bacteroidales bacterium]
MDWTLIITLISTGILLILLEIFLLPGMVAGILGGAATLFGIYQSYAVYGPEAGIITTVVTLALTVVLLILLFRSKTWKKAALDNAIDGRMNTESDKLNPGDEGKTITRLYPIGKAEINDNIYEVQSLSGIIEAESDIVVTKIEGYKIFVKPKNT